ncbi:hypothetical protein IT779_02585 [Nocardia sp. NEAU-351]|uniref:Uncharacterized protein n=1 Tax=Nocardia bovistercoris TaxID=2785916 RepID=A0A931I5D5_9NOCA|nr:hypothetical protein [Nocardia bovistercoris]
MFSIAALVPSPPILVPELGGAVARADRDDPAAPLRAAVRRAVESVAAVASRWTVLGAGAGQRFVGPDAVGTFGGFGVDVRVALSESAAADPDPELPLPVLIAGWLRGLVAPEATVEARLLAADAPAGDCAAAGAALRRELDAAAEPHAVLVVADGATTLTSKSPGYLDERSADRQRALDDALSAGDRDELRALDAGLCAELGIAGRSAYQALAGVFAADATDPRVETLYREAPFGVGYHVSVWRPGGVS